MQPWMSPMMMTLPSLMRSLDKVAWTGDGNGFPVPLIKISSTCSRHFSSFWVQHSELWLVCTARATSHRASINTISWHVQSNRLTSMWLHADMEAVHHKIRIEILNSYNARVVDLSQLCRSELRCVTGFGRWTSLDLESQTSPAAIQIAMRYTRLIVGTDCREISQDSRADHSGTMKASVLSIQYLECTIKYARLPPVISGVPTLFWTTLSLLLENFCLFSYLWITPYGAEKWLCSASSYMVQDSKSPLGVVKTALWAWSWSLSSAVDLSSCFTLDLPRPMLMFLATNEPRTCALCLTESTWMVNANP